jgi:polyisoprenoid-binding protein YceI
VAGRQDGTQVHATVTGDLDLHGERRPVIVEVELRWAEGVTRLWAAATVVQSRWGIRPYTAYLGTLRVAGAVRVDMEAILPSS